MYGPPSEHRDQEEIGLIPRAVKEIFDFVHNEQSDEVIQLTVYCSFIQIYNENLYDMLRYYNLHHPHRSRHIQFYVSHHN